MAFISLAAFSQTTVWNPAANNPSDGLWTTAANWTNGLPDAASKVVLNVPGAADCVLDAAATINQLVAGDNGGGDDVLRIADGGNLTTGAITWSAVAWTTNATLIVEKGGTVNFGHHFWAGRNAHATVEIYGTVNVANMFGIAFEPAWTGSGNVSVIDDGVLNLANIHESQSIPDGSFLNVTKNGVINITDDHVAKITNYITLGRITANGGAGTPIVELIEGKTVISVEDIAVTGITVTGEGGATTITKGGGTLQMIATILPSNSKDLSVTWSGNNEAVATIDADGLLSAVANGSVTVTATANDGSGVTGELVITVNIPATTVWNPAANPAGTGLWTEMANWTNGLPLVTSKVVLNVPNAADCVLDADATINQLVAGDNGAGDDVLRIADGGNLTTGAITWSAVAWTTNATLIVEKGGTVNFGHHFWAGRNAHATVEIYGTVNVANMFGIAFEPAWTGSGNVSVIDDGVLNLANIHESQSIPDGSFLNVTKNGVINITDDHVAKITNYITLGRITANGGAGTPIVELIEGNTVISVEDVAVTGITVAGEGAATTITQPGGTLQMIATVLPANSKDPSVTWSVNDETLATIDADGLLTAVANGDVTVTATANDGSGISGEIVITVQMSAAVTGITVTGAGEATTISAIGGTLQMEAAVLPAEATDPSVTWSVNDESVATIDANGLLTAVADGSVTVTATANDGSGVTGELVITVQVSGEIKVTGITVTGEGDATTITKGGGTLQMIATVVPANAVDPSVTWSANNEAVATIDANGLLSAVANGDVTVTATANDGSGVTGELVITVNLAGTTVWNPAANAASTGLWTEFDNWTQGLPHTNSKVVLNVANAADCVLDTDATIKQLVAGDNGAGDDVLRIVDGGNLTIGATTWSAVAWSSNATLIVEKGGTVSFGHHFWAGKDAHATVEIYGTVNVANMFGIAFEAAWTGSGNVSVIDDGVLNLANIHPDLSIPDGSFLDVTNNGVINITGDHVAKVENYIAQGRITANSGDATPSVELVDGTTVIKVLVIVDVEEIIVAGAGGAATITTFGGTLQMGATVVPANATDPSVTWSVDNEAVATIDTEGLLTAVANGVVTVTATANDGSGVSGDLAVTVSNQDQTGIGSADLLSKGLSIYPNPAGKVMNIRSSVEVAMISIIDVTGHAVRILENPGRESSISLEEIPAGVYILKIQDFESNTVTRRIIKQ